MKSSNLYSQTNNDRLKLVFYKDFSNGQSTSPFRYLWKLDNVGVISRTRIVSAIYKQIDKRDIENYRPISFSNLTIEFLLQFLRIE